MSWLDDIWSAATDADFWSGLGFDSTDLGSIVGGVGSTVADFLGSDTGRQVVGAGTNLGLGYLAQQSGLLNPESPKVGYQGKIPRYDAVRSAAPHNAALTGVGQRRFTDTKFVPSSDPQALAAARQQDAQQATNIKDFNARRGGQGFAAGGIASLESSRFLGGATDGMADGIPAMIDGQQPAAISDGEYVVPADVVSHLGNGNSAAGAKQLDAMGSRVRKARTGRASQGKQIDPSRMMPHAN